MKKSKAQKRPFIENKYTLLFGVRFSAAALTGFIFFGFVLCFFLNRRLGVSYLEDISTLSRLQEKLPLIMLATGALQAIVLSLVLFILSLFWAHSISGPLVRLHKYLKLLFKNEPEEALAFRKDDQLHHLAQSFRRMRSGLKARRERSIKHLDHADLIIKEYEDLADQKNVNQTQLEKKEIELKKVYEALAGSIRRKRT